MRTSIVAAAAAALCLAIAAPASASSIVYIKDHNVWIANPDGSGQHQVTTDGAEDWRYGSPSQADDGTIVASKGTDIVRLRQNGEVLSQFDPPATTDSAGQYIDGVPLNISVSPDGSKIAFNYTHTNCPPGVSCGTRSALLYSHSDRATPVEEFGKLPLRNASWVTNDRILAFGGYLQQVNFDSPGGGNDSEVHWFDDEDVYGQDDSTDLGDGELTRDGSRFVALRSYGDNLHVAIYAVNGNALSGPPPAAPSPACSTGGESTFDSPTWSPDGKTLAFAHKDGIETLPLPNVVANDCPGASSGTVVIPGGSEPDWGPADVNPGPPPCKGCDVPPPCNGCDEPPPCTTCPDKPPVAELKLTAPKSAKLKAARKGISFKVTLPGVGKLTAKAKLGKKSVGSASVTGGPETGPVKLKLRLSSKAKAGTVKVTFTYTPADGGTPVVKTISIKLKK